MVLTDTPNSLVILLAVALCFEAIAISVLIAAFKDLVGQAVAYCAVLSTIIGFVLCVCAIGNAMDQGGEKAIERELRAASDRNDRPRP
jgi:uncharacterized membrane protein